MLRFCTGIVLVGLVATAQAAQTEEDYFGPRLDLLSTQFAHSGTDLLPAYQISASVLFTRQQDSLPAESPFGEAPRFFSSPLLHQELVRPTRSNWQLTNKTERISLSHVFHLRINDAQVNMTVHPHALTIDGEQFKIILKPHSSSIQWKKPF